MKNRIAFDVSGLAWRYRTGVQNLYWAFVQAWARDRHARDDFDVLFYDRSGVFNAEVAAVASKAYRSGAPKGWPTPLRRPLQALLRASTALGPPLKGRVNHVWNWGIHAPAGVPASITIPDILPIEHPLWFDARFRRVTERSIAFARDRAQHVFVISHDVRRRLCDRTGLPADRVRVVYPGIDAAYFAPISTALADGVLARHGLRAGEYLLSSGFLDPRKNLARQLRAFEQAASRPELSHLKYALTGLPTALTGDLLAILESPALRSRVVFLGYVPLPDLIALTSRSAALMYCSLAEGFGLPVIEAMAVGAPVITSATTSMIELGTGRAHLVDPANVDAIAEAVSAVVSADPAARAQSAVRNAAFARAFTAENWLGGHLDAFAELPPRARWGAEQAT